MKITDPCDHCGEQIIQEYKTETNGKVCRFCCLGCQSVFEILNANGLTDYYNLKKSADEKLRPQYSEERFNYLDDPEFLKKYVGKEENVFFFKFFIEGVHCVACLWILEKLPVLCQGVVKSKLNMSTSILEVTYEGDQKLSDIARKIAILGYVPHPVMSNLDVQKLAKKEDQKDLIRIGVAFACAGNIMLYSLAIYAGADGIFRDYFNLFAFICSLPVVFFSATPFYQSALGAIKVKNSSIDIPIVLALVIGMLLGVYSFLNNADYFYFDTLSTLVFLLLSSRYILKKVQKRTLGATDLSSFFATQYAKKMTPSKEEIEVLTKFLNVGDIVVIDANESIPIDGVIVEGSTHINNSLLTGEVRPEKKREGDIIYMGAKNLDQKIRVKVKAKVEETRLGKMLTEIENGWYQESQIALITDKIAKRFINFIFVLSVFFLAYFSWNDGLEVAFTRTLSLLIITCPCALALTTPLALILGLSNMAKRGVVVKNENVIEKLTKADKIFLDKTGTLTYGNFVVVQLNELKTGFINHLYALERKSKHPIAVSILKDLMKRYSHFEEIVFDEIFEVPGKGVDGKIAEDYFEIKRINKNSINTIVGLFKNDEIVIELELADSLRVGVKESVLGLKKIGIIPYILTGDTYDHARDVAQKLNLDDQHIFAQKQPEEKRNIIEKNDKAIMVGDGVNDAVALKSAFVGIAVQGSVEISLRAADVYLSKSGVSHILGLIKASRYVMKIIYRNLSFSFVYNIVGVMLAFNGQVSPLVAAILMPLSSITVVISTVVSTNKLKKMIL